MAKKSKVTPRIAPAVSARLAGDRDVRIHVSPGDLYDFDKTAQLRAKVLEELGCANCHSGYDLRFEMAARDFTVSPRGGVAAVSAAKVTHLPVAAASSDATVRVRIDPDQLFNLDAMNKATRSILERLGCGECHSGFDIRYVHARDFVIDSKLNIKVVDTPAR